MKSGLVYLAEQVRSYFAANDVPAVVAKVGLTYRTYELNQSPGGGSRIVFIPGEFDGTEQPKTVRYGALRGPSNHSSVRNPRELWEWGKVFTISVWAAPDPAHPSDEELQLGRTEDLFEWTMRAVQGAVGGAADIERTPEVLLVRPPGESSFGTEFLIVCRQDGPLYDIELPLAFPSAAVNPGRVT